MQNLERYNGKAIPGFAEDSIKELKEEAPLEGMAGISPRYVQDKVSNAMVARQAIEDKAINPFMVLDELESGLTHYSLLTDEETQKRFRELLAVVKEEYEDIIKGEVRRAISADEDAIRRVCANYIESVRAYTQKEKVKNKYIGKDEEPDERLMRAIEEKIDIPESRKDDFRQEIMNYIGALSLTAKSSSTTPTPASTAPWSASSSKTAATPSNSKTSSPASLTTKPRGRSTSSSNA